MPRSNAVARKQPRARDRTVDAIVGGVNESREPELQGVLETVLYYEDHAAAERFYVDVLGMRPIAEQSGRFLFFRAGRSVFLLFDAAAAQKGEGLPAHGATGPGHVCFLVDPAFYESWKSHLDARGVEILQEVEWPGPRKSFYFRDPDDNLLEIADGDLWPD
jgi:catechol 2,3-dioxygenase-like lactoylglutathione lyase family enzyme